VVTPPVVFTALEGGEVVVAGRAVAEEPTDVKLAGIFEARSKFLADTEWSCFFLMPAPALADVDEAEDEDALLR
jgi:hypothetical protein